MFSIAPQHPTSQKRLLGSQVYPLGCLFCEMGDEMPPVHSGFSTGQWCSRPNLHPALSPLYCLGVLHPLQPPGSASSSHCPGHLGESLDAEGREGADGGGGG